MGRVPSLLLLLASLIGAPGIAAAEPDRRWHAGLYLRAELGTHPVRAGGGVEVGCFDVALVLDPMFWVDGQHDLDLLGGWKFADSGWALIGGYRSSSIGLAGGRQFHDKLVLGIGAPLPGFGKLPVRARWAFETSTVIVKHGAELPTEWLSLASGRDFIDLINFGMFVSFEYAAGF